ncbi:MAG: maturation protein [Hangzhou levivirus 1]|nr:MAG: maturation protein [Hangzhou levivirus 1]
MSRFRFRNNPPTTQINFVEQQIVYQNGDVIPNGSWNGLASYPNSEEMRDQVNPGFFKAEREGTLKPVSPMFQLKQEVRITPGGGTLTTRSWGAPPSEPSARVNCGGYFYTGAGEGNPLAIPPIPPGPALQEALARAQTDAWDSLTFAAEFNKTVETVVGLKGRIIDLYTRFGDKVASRARKTTKAVDLSKIIAEVWLEMRYAWRPLYYDIVAIDEAVRRLQEGVEYPLCRAYGTREETISKFDKMASNAGTFPGTYSGGLPGALFSCTYGTTVTQTLHASVGVQVRTRNIHLSDPLITAWELVPFSFILDWFVSIGDTLSAFSPFASGEVVFSTVNVTTEMNQRGSTLIVANPDYAIVDNTMVPSIWERITTTRSRVLIAPQPVFERKIDLNLSKVFDLIALAISLKAKTLKRILRHF